MRRKLLIIMCSFSLVALTGCGSKADSSDVSKDTVTTNQQVQEAESTEAEAEEETLASDPSVDLDLTTLSSTMIYSEVFNMMMEPMAYEGQTIKMDGNCAIYTDEETGNTYYTCVVQDATQCCSQGLEFLLDANQYAMEDYPADGDPIVIKGTFSTYEEDGGTYITIKDSVME
ncbi:MAG: hypothetical protein IJJ59_13580 [Pseudobutyrivibrio sp.]|uniref:LptM family lipoprotein n=1 Tax=Pseudobutyrivibrio sp. TaxID=2014367 RepID=UPI0025CCFBBC|nr:hypothetical protein [Pseudobutyrivibrio sp.]MBQ6464352.1 hypothetical protein [Pseudobutyrivibrio sp.]